MERTGALVVAWTDEQEAALPGIVAKAHRNGCLDVRLMATADLYRAEPELGPGARGAVQPDILPTIGELGLSGRAP